MTDNKQYIRLNIDSVFRQSIFKAANTFNLKVSLEDNEYNDYLEFFEDYSEVVSEEFSDELQDVLYHRLVDEYDQSNN